MKKNEKKKKGIKIIEPPKSCAAPPLCGQSTFIGGCHVGAVAYDF